MSDIETVRGWWDRSPCNIRHSDKPIGTLEYFDEVRRKKFFVEPHIVWFSEFSKCTGKKILELGCGLGTMTVCFAKVGAHVTAVDVSPFSVQLACQNVVEHGGERNVKLYCGDAERLKDFLPRQRFDLIYCFGMLHHTPNPEKLLNELYYYTNPDTVLKLMVYNRWSWKAFTLFLRYGWNWTEHTEAQQGSPSTRAYSRREIKALLESYGWTIQGMAVAHIFRWRIPEYKEHRYVERWYWRWMPPRLFVWLEGKIGWHICVTARRG